MGLKRSAYVVYNPETELWEVWQLTEAEAFLLDVDYYGVDVALENLHWEPDIYNEGDE